MKRLNKELLNANIEKIAEYDLSNNKVFGSAYCVIQEDKIVYINYFGNTSVNGENPVTENTLFRLASMTKPVTAIATLILVDRGLLSISDPVSKYLPEFADVHITQITDSNRIADLGKAKKDVTVCDLLTHTSGIGSEWSKIERMTDEDKKTVDNTVKFYADVGLDFEPRTKQQYSPTAAFDVLVKIIEQVTETDYLTFLTREIFIPCGMTDTTFVPTSEQWSRMIDMHNKVDGKSTVEKTEDNCVFLDYPCTHYLGGAGLISTLSDYSKFAEMLLNKGKTAKGRLLSEETFKLLHTPFVSEDIMPGSERWGLSVRVIVDESYKNLPVGSFGWSGAWGTHFWIDPSNKIAAIFMKNSVFDGGAGNGSALNFEKAVIDSLA